jgi:hypothetical protein
VQASWVRFLALVLLCAPGLSGADAVYQYDGSPFQDVAGRYQTTDSLSGSIHLSSPLAPNLSNASISLIGWSFSDGLKTFTELDSHAETPYLSTDGGGRIVAWSFDFSNDSGEVMGTFNNGPADQIDQATDFTGGNSLANNATPGTWALVGEPSTGALAGAALAVSLLTRIRARPSVPVRMAS